MIINAEVDENGIVRINDPSWRGKSLPICIQEWENKVIVEKTDWEALKEIFKQADALDFPRRTPEEILRDLHELRESE